MSALLSCHELSRSFGAVHAVDRVDLEVLPGSRHALIGPNGAGKSTLFKLITGLLRASSGHVRLAGKDITRLSEVRRARLGLSQTMQHASVFGTMTAAQNVTLAVQRYRSRAISPLPRSRAVHQDRVAELLAEAGLSERGDATVAELSHGEVKQLELALALACEPRLLLLDEPAAGMSGAESARLIELIGNLPAEVTVVLIEHDLDLVFQLATEVTVLHLGQVLLSGSPQEVRASTAVQEAYLGTDDRKALFEDPTTPANAGGPDVPKGQ